MINIVKLAKQDTYVMTCRYCGCVFTYQKPDIEYTALFNRPKLEDVKCPNCHLKCSATREIFTGYRAKIYRDDTWLFTSKTYLTEEEAKDCGEKIINNSKTGNNYKIVKCVNEEEVED